MGRTFVLQSLATVCLNPLHVLDMHYGSLHRKTIPHLICSMIGFVLAFENKRDLLYFELSKIHPQTLAKQHFEVETQGSRSSLRMQEPNMTNWRNHHRRNKSFTSEHRAPTCDIVQCDKNLLACKVCM